MNDKEREREAFGFYGWMKTRERQDTKQNKPPGESRKEEPSGSSLLVAGAAVLLGGWILFPVFFLEAAFRFGSDGNLRASPKALEIKRMDLCKKAHPFCMFFSSRRRI